MPGDLQSIPLCGYRLYVFCVQHRRHKGGSFPGCFPAGKMHDNVGSMANNHGGFIGKHLGNPLDIPSGELTFCHGKSPFLMGKSTISMAIFHCKLLVHQRVSFRWGLNQGLNQDPCFFFFGVNSDRTRNLPSGNVTVHWNTSMMRKSPSW